MNKCPKCDVILKTDNNVCPLCHNKIILEENNSIYPKIKSTYRNHNLLMKISLFTSICGIIFSLLINYWIYNEISWSIFVILGIISFWLTFSMGMNHKQGFMRILFAEIISIIILSIIWDLLTGFHKWSLTYCLPFLCICYTITFLIIRIFTRYTKKEYILYTYLNSLIGLFPLYFILSNKLSTLWPSYISVSTSIFALIFLFIFNHHTLETEIERRLHI